MACPFCATGQGGLQRNLSTAEIVDQVRAAAAALRDGDVHGGPGRLSNVVFMGMGGAARQLQASGRRRPSNHVTRPRRSRVVATLRDGVDGGSGARDPQARRRGPQRDVGRVAAHPPDDELRDTLVPVNNRWSVAEVLDAARYYADKSGRRVSIEYALIRDVNDQPWRADLLGKKLRKRSDRWCT